MGTLLSVEEVKCSQLREQHLFFRSPQRGISESQKGVSLRGRALLIGHGQLKWGHNRIQKFDVGG